MNLSKTDTTRYLCAAAYLSPTFRDSVIQLFKEDYRAIAISHGVDLILVIKHCLAAQKRELIKNTHLRFLLIMGCISAFLTNSTSLFIFPFFIFIIIVLIIFRNAWQIRYVIIPKTLSKDNFDPDFLQMKLTHKEKIKLDKIAKTQSSNVIVYGGFSPFVGSGFEIGGWSFALNLSKAKTGIEKSLVPISFEVEELYEYIDHAIRAIKLPELTIEDKLCVHGREVRENTVFLPNIFEAPSYQVNAEYIKNFVNKSTGHIRYYKHIKIISWQGELVFSVFLRLIKIDKNLFVETNYFVLCPVKNEHYLTDFIDPEINVPKVMPLVIGSIIEAVFLCPLSIVNIWNKDESIIQDRWEQEKMKRIIRETTNFNYGAITSVRELASPSTYNEYLQQLDQDMYLKIIENVITDSLCEFLEAKNIDISELNDRRDAIVNNGVIVSGGSIKVTNFSVGQQAKSVSINGLNAPFSSKITN